MFTVPAPRSGRRRPATARLHAFAALYLLAAASAEAQRAAPAAMTFDVRVTTARGGRSEPLLEGTGRAAGGRGRLDVSRGGERLFLPSGAYLLLDDAAATLTVVMPGERRFAELDAAGFGALAGGAAALVRLEATDVRTAAEPLGAGEMVLGHDTERVRVTQRYTLTSRVLGRRRTRHVETVAEHWIAPALAGMVPPLDRLAQALAAGVGAGSGLDEVIRQGTLALRPHVRGAVLRTVVRTTATEASGAPDAEGVPEASVTTSEVTRLAAGPVAPGELLVPDGFTRWQPTPGRNAATAASDTARAAPAAAARRALGRLIRRP